ncbi:MAG: hypothetical protein KDD73_09580 [Anaerolineales bacterium]|nr:hypothetical protein [Anaerolineales bacterium]MCB9126439.1 hypothetical protein [Ardenticatenales bacterium]MCB9171598.1 hypothetical protein [Ardenticatenales bacterium]
MPKEAKRAKFTRLQLTTSSALRAAELRKTMSVLDDYLPNLTEVGFGVFDSTTQANKCEGHTCSGTYDSGNPLPEPGDSCPGHSSCEAESCSSHSCTGHECTTHACDTNACNKENFTGSAVIPYATASSQRWHAVLENLMELDIWSGISLQSSEDLGIGGK